MDSYYVEPNFFATTFVSIISGIVSVIIDNQYNSKDVSATINKETYVSGFKENKETYASFMIKRMSDIKKKKSYIKAPDRFKIAYMEWNNYIKSVDNKKINKNKEYCGKYKFIFKKLCEIRKQNPEMIVQERIKIAKKAWVEHLG